MKPLQALIVLVAPLLAGLVHAVEPDVTVRPNAVIADLGLHVINAGYQRTVHRAISLQGSVGLYSPWMVNRNVLGFAGPHHDPPGDVIGGVIRLRALFYPQAHSPAGLWLSPFTQVGVVRGTRGPDSLLGTAFAIGISMGWAWLVHGRLLIAAGVGSQLHLASFAGSTEFPGFLRVVPTIDLNIGYAF